MTYRVHGLDPAPFAPLFAMDDAALEAIGARRMIAEEKPGFPCRVSLADAEPGEALILLSHEHMAAESSPYRAKGPIFVREAAGEGAVIVDVLPPYQISVIMRSGRQAASRRTHGRSTPCVIRGFARAALRTSP